MKKLLNTLYLTTEGAGLRKDGENLVAEIDGAERARVPFHMLGSVVVFGGTFVSPPLIGALNGSDGPIANLTRWDETTKALLHARVPCCDRHSGDRYSQISRIFISFPTCF